MLKAQRSDHFKAWTVVKRGKWLRYKGEVLLFSTKEEADRRARQRVFYVEWTRNPESLYTTQVLTYRASSVLELFDLVMRSRHRKSIVAISRDNVYFKNYRQLLVKVKGNVTTEELEEACTQAWDKY